MNEPLEDPPSGTGEDWQCCRIPTEALPDSTVYTVCMSTDVHFEITSSR